MKRLIACLVLFLCISGMARAADGQGMVRARLDPPGPVVPGQTVTLIVEALTTSWFTEGPLFPDLTIPGALVSPPSDRAVNLNTDIDGVRWFGLWRSYSVTPQRPGELAIPALTLILKTGPGGQSHEARSEPLQLTVREVARPPGMENALASAQLTVEQSFSRALDGLKPGDAFTRTITTSAAGVPAMQLPPVTFANLPGLAVYPAEPRLTDGGQNGSGVSRRIDSATYVVQQPGKYSLPGFAVSWWDTSRNGPQKTEVPGVSFTVAGAPAAAEPHAGGDAVARVLKRLDARTIAWAIAIAMALGLALRFLIHRLARPARALMVKLRQRREAYAASEVAARRNLMQMVRTEDAARVVPALYRWLGRSGAKLPEAERFLAAIYGRDGKKPDFAALGTAVRAWRREHGRIRETGEGPALPPLNPPPDPVATRVS